MRTLVATFAAIVILLPTISMAQQCGLLRQADELELTDQQIEQLQANAFAEHKEMIQYRADLSIAKLELRELMKAEQLNKTKIMKKNDKVYTIKAKMAKNKLEGKIDRLNMLTSEQRGKHRKNMMHHGYKKGHGKYPDMRGRSGYREYQGNRKPGNMKQEKCFKQNFGNIDNQNMIFTDNELEYDNDFVEFEEF